MQKVKASSRSIPFNKDFINYWLTIFHNNGIIKDYTMSKKEAHAIFKRFNKESWIKFETLLKSLTLQKYISFSKDTLWIIFQINKLDKILRDPVLQVPTNCCSICSLYFFNQIDLQNHEMQDRQHYLRHLYFTKSKLVKRACDNNLIKVTTHLGPKPVEVVFLNAGVKTSMLVCLKNCSPNIYVLEDIAEVNLNKDNIGIERNNLPINFPPNVTTSYKIHASIAQPVTTIFVLMYAFKNMKNGKELFLSQEITIHVTSESYNDLHSTSKYVRPVKKQNDIDTKQYIPLDVPTFIPNIVVRLSTYHVPVLLEVLLKAHLKQFKGINKKQQQYLDNIRQLLVQNHSGFYLVPKNYFDLLHLLLYMEEHQLSIDIRNYDTETKNLLRVKGYHNRYQLQVPDLAERRPSLLPGDSVFVKSVNSKTYQGVVRVIKQDSVILEFNVEFSNAVYTSGINLSVTYGYNRSIVRCEHRAVELLDQHSVLSPFFPDRIFITSCNTSRLHWFNQKIASNYQQQQAIRHILARTSFPSPYLIFGPPGTGKTMTIVEAISQVWKMQQKAKILVCAPSNSVANEIALRLTQYVPKTQLFRYMSVSFDMYNIPNEVLPFTNYDCGDFYTPTIAEVCSYRIVISTLSNAPRMVSMGVPGGHFSYVFIDESGHATESETLLAVAGLLTRKENLGCLLGQIVLAGDPEQLGPIIHSPYARQYGFGSSMLERLMKTVDIYKKNSSNEYNPMALTKLLNNYRSHPLILQLPNELFYEKELVPMGGELVNLGLDWHKLPNKKFPIIFHSVLGSDQRESNSPSYFNVQEIEIVMGYLNDLIKKRLKGRVITEADIGVIAPYRKQVQKIQRACNKKNWNDLTIGSVEQFQGQERLIIIISTVRSKPNLLEFDNKFHLGFLNNPKRFNVALTRAKALVIVVGNPNLLQYETYWRTFIQYCADNGCMTGAPFRFAPNPADLLALDMAKLRINGETDDSVDFSRGNI